MLLVNFKEQLKIGGSHSNMYVPTMLLRSLGRNSGRTLGVTTFWKDWWSSLLGMLQSRHGKALEKTKS